jgi:hypothetical protein
MDTPTKLSPPVSLDASARTATQPQHQRR